MEKARTNILIGISAMGALFLGFTILSWKQKAARIAAIFLNVDEIGNNEKFSSQVFEKMLREIGWKGGEAWCMYFAKTVYMQAFPKKAALIDKILNGSTQQSWRAAQQNPDVFKVITEGQPQRGDIVIWQSLTNPSLGHAGIVYKHDKGTFWQTIEGNSAASGTRDGQGVVRLTRNLIPGTVQGNLRVLGFIRMKTNIF